MCRINTSQVFLFPHGEICSSVTVKKQTKSVFSSLGIACNASLRAFNNGFCFKYGPLRCWIHILLRGLTGLEIVI